MMYRISMASSCLGPNENRLEMKHFVLIYYEAWPSALLALVA